MEMREQNEMENPPNYATLLKHKLRVPEGSINLIKELREYMWRLNSKGKPLNEPVKGNDHAIDALRYLITSPYLQRQGKLLPPRKIENAPPQPPEPPRWPLPPGQSVSSKEWSDYLRANPNPLPY